MEAHLDFDCIVGMAYHGISIASATTTEKFQTPADVKVVALVAIVDRGDGAELYNKLA